MNIRKYFLITDTSFLNPNPGDILIGKGIETLIEQAEKKLDNLPIFNYLNIFSNDEAAWNRMYEEADYLILCGTPQLGTGHQPPKHINQDFYDKLWKAKEKGIRVANMWCGICDTNGARNIEESVLKITEMHEDFIKKNMVVFDFITVRDILSKKVLEHNGIECTHLLDSVFYSPEYYDIKKDKDGVNLIVLKNMGEHNNPRMIEALKRIEKDFSQDRPLFYLAHDIVDYDIFKDSFKNILCINNPESLLKIYAKAREVLSFRVHGSIPAIRFGAKVMHIRLDSRTNNVEYTGLKPIYFEDFFNNPRLEFQKIDINVVYPSDKKRFFKDYYKKLQKRLGENFVRFSEKYCGADYWRPNGNSGYSSPICRVPTMDKFSDLYSKLDFKKGLELGCAGGYFTYLMNLKGKDFYGVDISNTAIDAAKNEFIEYKDKYHCSSIHDLSNYKDNSFDFIYSQQVLEHLPTELVHVFLDELYRVCNYDCNLALYLVIGYEGSIARASNDKDKTHWNLKTKHWWDKMFEQHGFTTITNIVNEHESLDFIKNTHRLYYKKNKS